MCRMPQTPLLPAPWAPGSCLTVLARASEAPSGCCQVEGLGGGHDHDREGVRLSEDLVS